MSELNFDNKTKEELEAIAAQEEAEAVAAQKEADEAAAKAKREAKEAKRAKRAAEEALAKKIAEEAGAPVNSADPLEAKIEEAWRAQAKRNGYPSRPRPEGWNPFN